MKEKFLHLSERIAAIKDKVKNEEATKQSLILPLLSILGYDIFNPEEVEPEVDCDISCKGDRIDYVICKNGKHEILIECKDWRQSLDAHINQLRKYFVASEARFAILTNGINYIFFSDHDKANIMDEEPFYSINMTNISDEDILFLSQLSKESFNSMQFLSISQDIRYRNAILKNLRREFANPSKGFVSLLTAGIYDGKLHESIYNKFSNIVKDCIGLVLTEDFIKDDEVFLEEKKCEEEQDKYTEDEQKIVDMVMGWLRKYETEDFHIYVRKLSDGYIRFCYNSEWWNICRIKVAWNRGLYIKICKDGLAAKSVRNDIDNIDNLESVRDLIESQCEDTKSRFFKYRVEHNL